MRKLLAKLTDGEKMENLNFTRRCGIATILAERNGWNVSPLIFSQEIIGVIAKKSNKTLKFIGRLYGDTENNYNHSQLTTLIDWAGKVKN